MYYRHLSKCRSAPGDFLRFLRASLVCVVSLFLAYQLSAEPPSEYELKAAFLLNFARFSEWPPETLPAKGAPLVIGILGTDPFGSALDTTVAGETVRGHPVVVRRFVRTEDFSVCHLIFIAKSELAQLPRILASLRGKHVLTISDIDHFAYQNGMIGMNLEKGRVRVHINSDRAKAEGIGISAKLLRLSVVVHEDRHSMLPAMKTQGGRWPRVLTFAPDAKPGGALPSN